LDLLARVVRIVEQLRQILWKYSDPTRRIRSYVVSATCHYGVYRDRSCQRLLGRNEISAWWLWALQDKPRSMRHNPMTQSVFVQAHPVTGKRLG